MNQRDFGVGIPTRIKSMCIEHVDYTCMDVIQVCI